MKYTYKELLEKRKIILREKVNNELTLKHAKKKQKEHKKQLQDLDNYLLDEVIL